VKRFALMQNPFASTPIPNIRIGCYFSSGRLRAKMCQPGLATYEPYTCPRCAVRIACAGPLPSNVKRTERPKLCGFFSHS
jgi:hypothetical protein